jgi:hypothetical protein
VASSGAQAQQVQNNNQFVYTNVVTGTLTSYLTASPNLIFNSDSGLFDFETVNPPTQPTVYVRNAVGQYGVFIFDDNPGDPLRCPILRSGTSRVDNINPAVQ